MRLQFWDRAMIAYRNLFCDIILKFEKITWDFETIVDIYIFWWNKKYTFYEIKIFYGQYLILLQIILL